MADDIWTIGHSNLELAAFLERLQAASIELLADVRRFPGSRRFPQFNRASLEEALGDIGILYRHFEDLGGRRSHRAPDSPNTAWRVESFNAYADHMQTPEFQASLEELIQEAQRRRTAIMCSEAVPWRCHRRLIADALIVRSWSVWDILGGKQPRPHQLTEFAKYADGRLTYPGGTLFPNEG